MTGHRFGQQTDQQPNRKQQCVGGKKLQQISSLKCLRDKKWSSSFVFNGMDKG